MALPKKKHSKTRGRKRRTHWVLKEPKLVPCPQCKQSVLPHHVCKVCGTYDGKQVVEVKVKEKKPKK